MKRASKRGPSTAAQGPMRAFARRFRELREARKITQKDLAQILRVQVALISRYERGLSVPSASTIVELAKVLQVTTDELLTGSSRAAEPPTIRHAVLHERFRRLDEKINDRRDLDALVIFLDAFLARRKMEEVLQEG